ncbi:S-layer homology domain-containing protein [Brassicibacter mesophilus]|uniref:S-layer homology domain-containing protein n=1 Tax=Brassicibacter mesophilus TaxID=745119 RepID=UPI003D1D1EFB
MKRYFSIFLVLIMFINIIPIQVLAQGGTETYDHDGYSLPSITHESSLDSLINQLSTEGITLPLSWEDVPSIEEQSEVEHRTRISYQIINNGEIDETAPRSARVRFTLDNPGNEQVSFDYRLLSGSSYIDKIKSVDSGKISFEAGETEIELEIELKPWIHKPTEYGQISEVDDFWTGERIFFIYCYNIENALFSDGKRSETIPVPIENSFDYEIAYENAGEYLYDLEDLEDVESIPEDPLKYINQKEEITIDIDIEDDVRTMIDMGVFTHLQLPTGYIENTSGATGSANYKIKNDTYFEKEEALILDGETEISFGGEEILENVGLGRNLEGNTVSTSLKFTLDYSTVTEAVYTCFDSSEQIRFSDQEAPIFNGIDRPFELDSDVSLGDTVPIILRYNEPVYIDDIRISINNEYYYPIEKDGTISESLTFLYEVDEELYENNGILYIENISGAMDLSGNEQEEALPSYVDFNMNTMNIINDFFFCAEPIVNIEQGTTIQPMGYISIPLKEHTDLSNWLSDNLNDTENLITVVKARVIGQEGIAIDVPLYAQIEGGFITELTGQFIPPINLTGEDIEYIAEIYLMESSEFELVYGLTAEYIVQPIIFITSPEDLEIEYKEWPATDRVSADGKVNLSLDYNIKVDATWDDSEYFRWTSSDETVATINSSTGIINLTGKAGTVQFTLTASNAGLATEVEVTSRTLTVMPIGSSFLSIPECGKNIESMHGQDVMIQYSTNIPYNNVVYGGSEAETTFTYTLYEANYDGYDFKKGEIVYTEDEILIGDSANNFFMIPSKYLTNTAAKDRYSYIAEVSSRENETGYIYTAEANIRVKSLPVKAILDRPDSFYMTDDSSHFDVSFNIENENENTEYRLSVKKNKREDPIYSANSPEDMNRYHRISIESVDPDGLLDVYTVSLEAKNECDEVWSFDSYTIYIYNSNALKILVNEEFTNELIIKPSLDFSKMDSSQIISAVSNNRKMNFSDKVSQLSIYNENYNLSNIADKITWKVGNEGNLVLKYKDIDITEDTTQLMKPGASLVLEAIDSGISSVTATHYNTGIETTLPVIVEDKPIDKLYVFYTYPQSECLVTYKNGNKEEKTVKTDYWGRLGVYEETGIASDVVFYPIDKADVYGTTVFNHSQLVANQNSSNNFDIYPQNTVKLVPSSKYNVNLNLYKYDDGSPFTEDIIIRGGVYVNGEYIERTTINGKKGNEDQIVSATNGIYNLTFNPKEFTDIYGRLDPDTQIEYKIEVSTRENTHYPLMIELTNNEIRDPNNANKGIYASGKIQETKDSSIQNNVIVTSQSLTLDGEKYSFDSIIGIGNTFNEAIVSMDLIFSNAKDAIYEVSLQDKFGFYWGSTTRVKPTDIYPFSRTGVLHVSMDMKHSINNGLVLSTGRGESVQLFPVIRKIDELTLIKLSKPLILQNLFLPSMTSSNNWENGIYDIRYNVLSSIEDAGSYSSLGEDSDVKEILEFLSGFSGSISSIGLEIIPTEDPLIYRGIIRFSLGNYARDNPSGLFVTQGKSTSYEYLPGFSDIKAMGKGNYIKQSKKTMEEAKSGIGVSGRSKTYGGGSYMECQIYWNKNKNKWDMRLLKSDSYIGGGVHYSKIHNTSIGGFPVTAEFKTGVTTEIGLKTIYDIVEDSTAYITELRPNGYIYGFGGAGVDLKVTAIKIGPYGQINHEQKFLWYDFEDISKNGQKLTVSGSTGIEYKLQFLFFSKKGKYELLSAGKSWTYNDFNEINDVFKSGKIIRMSDGYYIIEAEEEYESEIDNLTFQDRNYLYNNYRSWGEGSGRSRLKSLDIFSSESISPILTNAYPSSNPVMSEDGKIMVYIHDMDSTNLQDTAVNFALRDSIEGVFTEGEEILSSDYPDSDAAIAGTEGNAVVVWTRTFTDIEDMEGKEATDEDIVNVLDATEIMTAVYDSSTGEFETIQLTNNSTSDMVPVVAAKGNRAIVAWHSVIPGDRENPLDFSAGYEILYSTYDGTDWDVPKVLYNDTIDHVEDTQVAMLTDGTSAVLYQVKKEGGSSEIMATLLDEKGKIKNNLRLTNDDIQDTNPQITVVELPDGDEGFVIGWNTENTIQILAMDGNGNLYKELEQEIGNPSEISNYSYSDFCFVKGAKNLDDLTIVWDEPDISSAEGASDIYRDNIWGIKLIKEADGTIGYSGKVKLVELDGENTADFYEVVTIPETDELQFVMMVSDYSSIDEKCDLITAKFSYQNEISVDEPDYLFEDVIPGMDMPVAFNIQNLGIKSIDNITITIEGVTHTFDEYINPGDTKELVVFFPVPDPVDDIHYTITAEYEDSKDIKSGILKLDMVDVAIDKITVTKEKQRERGFNIQLSNKAYGELKEGIHTVKLEIYNSPDFDMNSPISEETISDGERLELINDGALSLDMVLDEDGLKEFLNEDGEIPDGGALVFFNAEVIENEEIIEDAEIGNDMNYILIRSLVEKYGMPVNIGSMLHRTEGQTEVKIEAFNNSINGISNGNFVAFLKDESGKILEKQQSYDPNNGLSSLVQIRGEESFNTSLDFTQEGALVDVFFTEINENSTKLSMLKMDGVYLDFKDDVYQYDIDVKDLKKTFILAEAEDPESTITIKQNGSPITISQLVTLSYGINRFVVTVVNGEQQQDYIVNIRNLSSEDSGEEDEEDNDNSGKVDDRETENNSTMTVLINGIQHRVSIRIIDGNAIITFGALEGKSFTENENVVLSIPKISGAKSYALEVPVGLITSSNNGLITFDTPLGSITLSRVMFSAMSENLDKTTSITIESGDKSLLPRKIGEAIGERPFTKFTMLVDGKEIDLKESYIPISISIPYTLNDDELFNAESMVIWHIDEGGNVGSIPNGVYNATTRTMKFHTNYFCDYGIVYNKINFKDVGNDQWYSKAVNFIAARGITTGTGNGNFSPDDKLTRGQFITMLMRAYGFSPDVYPADNFADAGNTYYTNYLSSAKALGISQGVGNNRYEPEREITRQEMFVLIYNALKIIGSLPEGSSEMTMADFTDAEQIESWAKQAITLLIEKGTITGSAGELNPTRRATRAEMAQIMFNLLSK